MTSIFCGPWYQLLILPFIFVMFLFTGNVAAQSHIAEFDIVVTVKGFIPNVIEVPQGSEVRLNFTTPDTEHSLTPSAFGVEKTVILPGGETALEFTAEESGTFKLGCTTLCSYRHFLFMRPVLTIRVES